MLNRVQPPPARYEVEQYGLTVAALEPDASHGAKLSILDNSYHRIPRRETSPVYLTPSSLREIAEACEEPADQLERS